MNKVSSNFKVKLNGIKVAILKLPKFMRWSVGSFSRLFD